MPVQAIDSLPLENQKWERFAQLVSQGVSGTQAYAACYPDSTLEAANSSAARMLAMASVADRVSALKQASAAAGLLTKDETQSFLAQVVRSQLANLPETSHLVQAIRRKDGETVEIKVPDKLKALEINAKLAGWLDQLRTDQGVVNINLICTELPSIQLPVLPESASGQDQP